MTQSVHPWVAVTREADGISDAVTAMYRRLRNDLPTEVSDKFRARYEAIYRDIRAFPAQQGFISGAENSRNLALVRESIQRLLADVSKWEGMDAPSIGREICPPPPPPPRPERPLSEQIQSMLAGWKEKGVMVEVLAGDKFRLTHAEGVTLTQAERSLMARARPLVAQAIRALPAAVVEF